MLKEKEVQAAILKALNELHRAIKNSERKNYTREELLDLLDQVATMMKEAGE